MTKKKFKVLVNRLDEITYRWFEYEVEAESEEEAVRLAESGEIPSIDYGAYDHEDMTIELAQKIASGEIPLLQEGGTVEEILPEDTKALEDAEKAVQDAEDALIKARQKLRQIKYS